MTITQRLSIILGCAILSLAQTLPPASTLGVLNPHVSQSNIKSTICAHGWTATIRPPASFTTKLKKAQMLQLSLTGSPADYEEDHRVPLEIGGNPVDPRNLWPEPWSGPYGAHEKDKLENAVKRDICSGVLTLDQGRAIFLGNFWDEYRHRYKSK